MVQVQHSSKHMFTLCFSSVYFFFLLVFGILENIATRGSTVFISACRSSGTKQQFYEGNFWIYGRMKSSARVLTFSGALEIRGLIKRRHVASRESHLKPFNQRGMWLCNCFRVWESWVVSALGWQLDLLR